MTLMGSSQKRVRPIISSRMIAALFTRMSSLPCSRCDLVEQRLRLLVVGMVDVDGDPGAPGGRDQFGGFVDRAAE